MANDFSGVRNTNLVIFSRCGAVHNYWIVISPVTRRENKHVNSQVICILNTGTVNGVCPASAPTNGHKATSVQSPGKKKRWKEWRTQECNVQVHGNFNTAPWWTPVRKTPRNPRKSAGCHGTKKTKKSAYFPLSTPASGVFIIHGGRGA